MGNENNEIGRRRFLKRISLAGAAVCLSPTLNRITAAERIASGKTVADKTLSAGAATVGKSRTLGSGNAAMTVSAMGFGCMGLNHHRGYHPDKKAAIRLVHEAIDRGVTLFDTAESYGYHKNEMLTGEALNGYSDRVFVTTKFGHKFVNGVQVKTEEDSSPAKIIRR